MLENFLNKKTMIIFLDWRRERVEEFRSLEVEECRSLGV
jgi:hypothetical protein